MDRKTRVHGKSICIPGMWGKCDAETENMEEKSDE